MYLGVLVSLPGKVSDKKEAGICYTKHDRHFGYHTLCTVFARSKPWTAKEPHQDHEL